MNNEDVSPITLASNYSGACEHVPLSNEVILNFTDQQRMMIYGPTLFALKYRILPCTLKGSLQAALGDDDANTFDLNNLFSIGGRERQRCAKRKQEGMYHATRFVILLRAVFG
jgi:hypothetical protein